MGGARTHNNRYVGADSTEEGVVNFVTKVVLFHLSIAGSWELTRYRGGGGEWQTDLTVWTACAKSREVGNGLAYVIT